MDAIRTALSAVKVWVEGHALGVGVAGLVALVVGTGVGVAGLGGGSETSPTTTVAAPDESIPATETTAAGEVSPPTSDGAEPTGTGPSLIAVKIDNAPEARPQIGLAEASLVIEVPVEGGLTRFTALYEDGSFPQVAGPVRSVRPVDADLVAPLSSVMAATGGQRFVVQGLAGSGVSVATPDTAPGYQALERPVPYNLFVDLSQIQSVYPAAAATGEAIPVGEVPAGADASSITIPYASEVSWTFADGVYGRSEGGEVFEVLSDPFGEASQLTAETVVVLFAAQRSAGYTDTNGADVPTFDVIGSGDLLVFHGGQVTREPGPGRPRPTRTGSSPPPEKSSESPRDAPTWRSFPENCLSVTDQSDRDRPQVSPSTLPRLSP
jgi:hypothetical protein